jgi:5-methylcytosine-specific restriction endonuclease McrA
MKLTQLEAGVVDNRRLFTKKEKLFLRAYYDFKCALCGKPTTHGEADHIIPFSKNGKTEIQNAQFLCVSCNRKKGNKLCKDTISRREIGKKNS